MDQGVSESAAECVVSSLVAQGVTEQEIINNENTTAIRTGLGVCLEDDDLPELLGVSSLDEVRAVLAQNMSDASPMSRSEAECLVSTVEAQGFSLVEIGGFQSAIAEGADVAAALTEAQPGCVGS